MDLHRRTLSASSLSLGLSSWVRRRCRLDCQSTCSESCRATAAYESLGLDATVQAPAWLNVAISSRSRDEPHFGQGWPRAIPAVGNVCWFPEIIMWIIKFLKLIKIKGFSNSWESVHNSSSAFAIIVVFSLRKALDLLLTFSKNSTKCWLKFYNNKPWYHELFSSRRCAYGLLSAFH